MVSIDGNTTVFGILGHPVSHSLSPRIHNAAFRATGFNGVYVPFDMPEATERLKNAIFDLNLGGLSVTIPYKTLAARIADEKDPLTRCSGAANTLLRVQSTIAAKNTDGPGALKALRRHTELSGKRILMIGYGGSAAAIAHSLLLDASPAALLIGGRNSEKTGLLIDELRANHPGITTHLSAEELRNLDPDRFDIAINTTPLGMKGDFAEQLPVPETLITKHHVVFDIVYTPRDTPLLRVAEKKGAHTVPGYLMLLYQAVLQFELFTGISAPVDVMENELLHALDGAS